MTTFALATGLTPEATVVSTAKPHTDEWFAARRQGITATDIPKIVGSSKYGNALSVWMDKAEGLAEPNEAGDLEAAEWGLELEPVIMRVWSRRHGGIPTMAPETLANKRHRWMIANLDRIAMRCPDDLTDRKPWGCGVEIKTRSGWTASTWRDDMPDDVLAQVAWQRMVTGYGHIHVVALIGGQRLIEYTYQRDEGLEAFITGKATEVWEAVQAGEPPQVEPDALLADILNRLYPNRAGIAELADDAATRALALLEAYENARLGAKRCDKAKVNARAGLVQLLDDNDIALLEGQPAFSYKAATSGTRTLRIDPAYRKEDADE